MINRHNKKLIMIVCALILILGYVFIFHFNDIKRINLKMIEDYIKSYGRWSIAVFLGISTIRPLAVVIPITLITLIAGSIYGPVYGFLLAMVSTIISSNVAFLISRYFGKSFVEKIIKNKAQKINLRIEKNGFKIIFVMRISGIFPLDIVSYTAGLSKVKYRDFMLATILGVIPETFSVAYLGHNIKNPLSPGFILSIVLIVITIGIPLLTNKWKAKNNKE